MSGGLVSPHSPEMLRVRLAKPARVSRERLSVCENVERARSGAEGDITLQISLAISQARMFQIFTKNRLFMLQSTFPQICVLNILKSLHMNL